MTAHAMFRICSHRFSGFFPGTELSHHRITTPCKGLHPVLPWRIPVKQRQHQTIRAFKTAWFTKAAKKAHISDLELCQAVQQAILGQVDDLGGGVFKKRLKSNMHRSIILAKGGRHWVYEYLFAKKDRDNIEDDELVSFRALAKAYAGLSDAQIEQLIQSQGLMEICHDC